MEGPVWVNYCLAARGHCPVKNFGSRAAPASVCDLIFMKIFINANYAPDTSFPSLLCLG